VSARDRRDQRHEAPAATLSREQHAFAQGKRSAERGAACSTNPYSDPHLRARWLAGWYYARKLADGLRPLDTARRLP
jgi:ribosome modulation factor